MDSSIIAVRHLRTLAALRDTGSLVRAAQLLHLTQSALSHQINRSENGRRQFQASARRLNPRPDKADGVRV